MSVHGGGELRARNQTAMVLWKATLLKSKMSAKVAQAKTMSQHLGLAHPAAPLRRVKLFPAHSGTATVAKPQKCTKRKQLQN